MIALEHQALNEKKDRVELLEKLQVLLKTAETTMHPMDVIGIAKYAVDQYEAFHFGTCLLASIKESHEKGQS